MDVSERHDELLELCAGYAIGSLDDSDRARLEAHLSAGCAECEAALADFSAATVALAASVPAAFPSAALRARVLEEARVTPVEDAAEPEAKHLRPTRETGRVVELPRRRVSAWTWGFAAAAAA